MSLVKCELCSRNFDARKRKFVFIRRPDLISRYGPHSIQTSRRRFCSKICLERIQQGWVAARCQNCSAEFSGKTYSSWEALWQSPLFCSVACKKLLLLRNWRIDQGAWKELRTNWNRIKDEVKSRDGYVCQACGKTEGQSKLFVDHIVPFILSQSNYTVNLILLCHSCHSLKTVIESQLLRGQICRFLKSLKRAGWPMSRVRPALKVYDLPVRVGYDSISWSGGNTRWVVAKGKPCHIRALPRWLAAS
jgi:5-methylcytosine-specific restriction endonuclease McrA